MIRDWTRPFAASSRAARPSLRDLQDLLEEEEEQRSLLRTLGSPVISGLSYVGGVLDKPGAALRGTLSGLSGGRWGGSLLNLLPFSGAMGLTPPEKRVYGRELLENWGMLGANRPGLDVGDVAGFGAEVALDPLAWMTGGLSKAGQLAGKAGILAKAATVAGTGKRVARMTMTARKVLRGLSKAERHAGFAAWRDATAKLGAGKARKLLDEPLGGTLGISAYPMGRARWVVSPGGEKVARGLDVAAEAIRYSRPVRALAERFHPPAMGATTRLGQHLAEEVYPGLKEARTAARAEVIPEAIRLHKLGVTDPAVPQRAIGLQEAIEQVAAPTRPLPAEVVPSATFARKLQDTRITREHARGINTPDLDDTVAYLTRERQVLGRRPRGAGREAFQLDVGPYAKARATHLRGHPGGTGVLQDISLDPQLAGTRVTGDALGAARDYMLETYAHRLREMTATEARQLARWAVDLDPAQVARGIPAFSTDIPGLLLKREQIGRQAEKTAELIQRLIARTAKHADEAPAGWLSAPDVLKQAKLTWNSENGLTGANAWLIDQMKKTGKSVANADELANWMVPPEHIGEIVRLARTYSAPEQLGALGKGLDSFMNWWRASVTVPWPAYLNRNLGAGQIANYLVTGGNPLRVFARARDMDRLLRGKVIADAVNYPVIKRLGIKDPKRATEKLAEILGVQEAVGMFKGQALEVSEAVSPSLISQIPGMEPFPGVLSTIRQGIPGRGTWKPWETAGVGGLREDIFAPVAAGRVLNRQIEGLNRGGLILDLLKQGWDPAAATAKADLVHVAYGTATEFERRIMRRTVPFYRFLKGQADFLANELIQRPGGGVAQSIRGAGALREREPFLPDYLSQTTAIPVGRETPLLGRLFGPKAGGPARYISGFGLMHEDPLQLLGGGRGLTGTLRGLGQELGSRAAPWIKTPIELTTGVSLFQAGPRGGRLLEDMDPALGRLLANLSGRKQPVRFPGSETVEHLLMGVVPRPVTTLRTLTDPRKRLGETVLPGPAALSNVLTGVRFYDLPQASQERVIREAVEGSLRKTGLARGFRRTYVPAELLEGLPPGQQAEIQQRLGLLNLLGRRARQRAEGLPTEPLSTR